MARFYMELLLRDAKCMFSSFPDLCQNVIISIVAAFLLLFVCLFFLPEVSLSLKRCTVCIHFCSNLFNAIVQAELTHPWSCYHRFPQAPNCVELLAQALLLLFPNRSSTILSVLNLFMFSDVNLILSVCT